MNKWTQAERQMVFIVMGKFNGDQRKRFARAPFDLVYADLDGDGAKEFYLETVGYAAGTDDFHSSTAAIDDADFPFQARTGYGYLGEPVYVEDAGMGNGADDSWLSQHYFGPI